MDKLCLLCQKPIKGKKSKKFCNQTCKTRYNSRIYHQKHKNDIEYKEKNKVRLKKWVNENRLKFNIAMRKSNKIYQKKRYHKRLSEGLCPTCGLERDGKWKNCLSCRRGFIKNNAKHSKIKK